MDDIRIGLDVYSGSERVGHVARLVADSRDARITDIVVDRGLLRGAKIVPLGQIEDVQGGKVQLALDRDQFEHADGFVNQRFRNPDTNWSAPPGYDPKDFLLDAEVAFGSTAGYGATSKPGPFPPAPSDPRPSLIRPVVQEGTAVRTAGGERVGEIAEIRFDPEDGRLTDVVMKSGFFGRDRMDLPLEWIRDLDDEGLVLSVDTDEIHRHQQA